jgi:hypothetical protein
MSSFLSTDILSSIATPILICRTGREGCQFHGLQGATLGKKHTRDKGGETASTAITVDCLLRGPELPTQTIGSNIAKQGELIVMKRMYGLRELLSGNGFGNGISKGVTARRGRDMCF